MPIGHRTCQTFLHGSERIRVRSWSSGISTSPCKCETVRGYTGSSAEAFSSATAASRPRRVAVQPSRMVFVGTSAGRRVCDRLRYPGVRVCTYNTYMPNKTISLPNDVLPIIGSLDVPFSRWVAEQLRRHAAQSTMTFAEQIRADAALVDAKPPSRERALEIGERMDRGAPW